MKAILTATGTRLWPVGIVPGGQAYAVVIIGNSSVTNLRPESALVDMEDHEAAFGKALYPIGGENIALNVGEIEFDGHG